jgi:hypothetical protein
LLEQDVFPAVTAIRFDVPEVLCSVEFDDHSAILAQEVHLHPTEPVECDG